MNSVCMISIPDIPSYLGRFSGTSRESMRDGTQLVSSVQSACSPQLQPVEKREKSQVSFLPGLKQVHFFWPAWHSQGLSSWMFLTRCRPNVVPPVFWMCRKTMTSSPLMLKSTTRFKSALVKLNRGTKRTRAPSSAMYGSLCSPSWTSLPLVLEPAAPPSLNQDPSWWSIWHSDLLGQTYWIMMTPKSNTMSRTIRSRWWLLLLLDFSSIFPGRTEKHHSGSPDPCLGRGTSSNGVYQATKWSENNNNAAASQLTIASQSVDWVSKKRTMASYNCCCMEGNNAYISHSVKCSSFWLISSTTW